METEVSAPTGVHPTGCCPPFDPAPFQDRELTWQDEPFVFDHVRSVFHIPIGLGKHVTKDQALIEAAGATPRVPLMLCDEKSPWGTDVYIHVKKPVVGAAMASLSGTFLTRVYEGPYSRAPEWAEDMKTFVASRGKTLEKIYFAYTTCPSCAKAYGKNYVVLFARVRENADGPVTS
jgi:hypothetical protein